MNDMAQDAWFYTREGEKIGPVIFSDLQIKAKEGQLNPRLDMVWTQGMEAWKPVGEIEGLFERRTAPEPQETLAPPADPYKPPAQESTADKMAKEGGWPGTRRRGYLLGIILFPIVWNVIVTLLSPMLKQQFGGELMKVIVPAAALLPAIVWIYFGITRLVNLGMSRWWFLGNLVPILNIWVGYRCFACPAGFAFHKKLDGAGVFLAIVYWLLFALAILAMAAVVAVIFGALGTPELRQQIQDALQKASQPPATP